MNGTCKFEGKSGAKHQDYEMNTGAGDSNMGDVRVSSKEDQDLEAESDAGVSGSARSEVAGARLCSDSDWESRDLEVKNEVSGVKRFVIDKNDPIGAEEEEFDRNDGRNERLWEGQGQVLSRDRSLLDEFDTYVASERNERRSVGLLRDLSYVFEVGDMVWGKVKSHPWWPGHIFNEAFASASVRRTRREGHALVAFFGDSSYGWFEPAELIPFDENFAEKSRQTNSRTFLKAVEEAVDEASRRRGLGLVCKCRNSNNFRLTYVPGYFAVDVPEYEPGGVYSIDQIRKARSSFKPNETLDFVKHLAADPLNGDPCTSSFIQNKATVHAYRRAVFEQNDETYSEAFGIQLQRSLTQVTETDQPFKVPPKAPLSGSLVIAEALGGGQSSTMSMKVNNHSKKNKYLFRRREEPNNSSEAVLTASESSRGKTNIPIPLAYVEESSEATGMYLIQKRSPVVSSPPQAQLVEYERKEPVSVKVVPSIANVSSNNMEGMDRVANSNSLVNQDIAVDLKTPNGEKENLLSMPQCLGEEDVASTRIISSMPDPIKETANSYVVCNMSLPSQLKSEVPVDIKPAESTKLCRPLNQPDQKGLANVDEDLDKHNSKGDHTLMLVAKKSVDVSGIIKVKHHKRRPGDSAADSSVILRKKKKMVPDTQTNSDPSSKQIDSGKWAIEKQSKKSGSLILSARDDKVAPLLVNAGDHDLMMDVEKNVDLQKVLNDLHALALHPFCGFEENIIDNVLLLILRFRSLVYQKSLVSSPRIENESSKVHVTKYQTGVAVLKSGEHVRPSPPVKHVKSIIRPDDPTKAGRKRTLSDRQEDIAARKQKKINDIRILATEKKVASQRELETRRGSKEIMPATQKFAKPNSIKRVETPAKMEEPTMLVIKCPPQTSLPSLAELKARFARFGPLDQSGLRVFWTTSTCRVVFLRKPDAEAAYKYTTTNNTLFGGARVRCFLRGVADPTNEVSEAGKLQADYNTVETSKVKDSLVLQQQTSVLAQPSPGQSSIQLKSCLKKSLIDETYQVGGNGGGGSSKGTPRVKFMLGEEESRREQLTVDDRDSCTSTSVLDGGTSSVALDYNSKNMQNFVSQAQMSVPTTPPQYAVGPQNNMHNSQTEPRNTLNFTNPSTSSVTTATTVDISQQMLFLLTRCNDVVINVTGLLGYVPYHPL